MAFDEDDDERPKWIKEVMQKHNEDHVNSADVSPVWKKEGPLARINSPSKLVALKLDSLRSNQVESNDNNGSNSQREADSNNSRVKKQFNLGI